MVGQSADVVVALDNSCVAHAALDNVRVYRALNKVVHLAYFLGFRFEHPYKFLAYYLALVLRLGNAGEL